MCGILCVNQQLISKLGSPKSVIKTDKVSCNRPKGFFLTIGLQIKTSVDCAISISSTFSLYSHKK